MLSKLTLFPSRAHTPPLALRNSYSTEVCNISVFFTALQYNQKFIGLFK